MSRTAQRLRKDARFRFRRGAPQPGSSTPTTTFSGASLPRPFTGEFSLCVGHADDLGDLGTRFVLGRATAVYVEEGDWRQHRCPTKPSNQL